MFSIQLDPDRASQLKTSVKFLVLVKTLRDSHVGMPEIIDASEDGGQYFGVVRVEIGGKFEKFRFGVSQAGYQALKRVLKLHPFDSLPGLDHRYFFAGKCSSRRS